MFVNIDVHFLLHSCSSGFIPLYKKIVNTVINSFFSSSKVTDCYGSILLRMKLIKVCHDDGKVSPDITLSFIFDYRGPL